MDIGSSVVIRDFNFPGVVIVPSKTNAVLIVNPDTELTFAVAMQFFEPVSGRISQVFQPNREVDSLQLANREPDDVAKFPAFSGEPDLSSWFIPE